MARRMLKGSDGVIARLADTTEDARTAAAEGANLIVLQVHQGHHFLCTFYCSIENK